MPNIEQRQNNVFILFLFFYPLFAFAFYSNEWFIISILVLFLVGLYRYELALYLYIAMLPFWPFLGGVFSTVTSMVVLIFIYFLSGRFLSISRYLLHFGIFLGAVIFFVMFSSLVSAYYDYIHVTVPLLLTLSLSYLIVETTLKNPTGLFFILLAFVIAGLVAGIVSFENSGGELSRLTLGGISWSEGGNVRNLANLLGIALIVLLVPLRKTEYWLANANTVNRLLFLLITSLIGVFLLATSSRGVIFSVLLSLVVYFVVTALVNRDVSLKKSFYLIASVVLFSFLFFLSVDILGVDNSLLVLEERLSNEELQVGALDRIKIWLAGLSSMSSMDMLFGSGISSFRSLALQNGFDYYSHSFFVGAFVDLGLFSFVWIMLFMVYVLYLIKRNRAYTALPVFLYCVVSHATHGSLASQYFWILLGLSYAIAVQKYSEVRKKI